MTRPRALVVGIDGGSLDLVEPLVDAGRLPVIGRLMRTGAWARTGCTWPAHTAPGWTSFVSARRPGGHGVFQFFDMQHPAYGARVVGSHDVGCSIVWDWLAAQGLTAGIVNVPMSHPPRPITGAYQVTWPLTQTLRYSDPPDLLGELAKAGAPFRPDLHAMYRGDHGYVDEALANVDARVASVRHLMRTRPTDVVMVVFTEVDRVSHHYWHFADEGHPGHETPDVDSWRTAIERTYEAVDAAIGELLTLVDEDTHVVLASDHGFGPGRLSYSVHRALEDAGLLRTRPAGDEPDGADWFRDEGRAADWSRTLAYLPVPGSYGVNVNLAGRQRSGIVATADRERVLDDVAAALREVRVPDTGRPLFADLAPAERAYAGAYRDRAPDLLLVPADEGVMVTANVAGETWRPSGQTGLHRYEGMWVHTGPGVTPAEVAGPVGIEDLVPTLLHSLGVRAPAGLDGGPVHAAFSAPREPLPPLPGDWAGSRSPADPTDSGEQDITRRRLTAMGYL